MASGLAGALALWTSQVIPSHPVQEFAFAWLLHWGLMVGATMVVPQMAPRAAGFLAFQVGPGEVRPYRAVGVPSFNRVLDLAGWNRLVQKARRYTGKRGELEGLAEETWRSELGHRWAFLTTLLMAVPLCFSRPGVVGWLLLLAIPLHVYPIMLQRILRWRIQQIIGVHRPSGSGKGHSFELPESLTATVEELCREGPQAMDEKRSAPREIQ